MENAQTILVLDEDAEHRRLCENVLRRSSYAVISYQKPQELLEALERTTPPSAILLDADAPERGGFAVLEKLQDTPLWCLVPVILLTACPSPDLLPSSGKLPVPPEGCLVKPIRASTLLQVIEGATSGREPLYQLRRMQRRRLALRLTAGREAQRVDAAFRIARQHDLEIVQRLVQVRREIEALRATEAEFEDPADSRRGSLLQRISALEGEAAQDRRDLRRAQLERNELLRKWREVLGMQKAIRDLDQEIADLRASMKAAGEESEASLDEKSPEGFPSLPSLVLNRLIRPGDSRLDRHTAGDALPPTGTRPDE